MEWFKGKTKEIIALVTIVSTLAGFGYAGAGYVNRLENLEAKIGGIAAGRENLQNIEERFAGIEASVNLLQRLIKKTACVVFDNLVIYRAPRLRRRWSAC